MKTISNTFIAGSLKATVATTFTPKGVKYEISVDKVSPVRSLPCEWEAVIPRIETTCSNIHEVSKMGKAILERVIDNCKASINPIQFMDKLGDATIKPLVAWEIKTKGIEKTALEGVQNLIEMMKRQKEEAEECSCPECTAGDKFEATDDNGEEISELSPVARKAIKSTIRPSMEKYPMAEVEIKGITKKLSDELVAEVRHEINYARISGEIDAQLARDRGLTSGILGGKINIDKPMPQSAFDDLMAEVEKYQADYKKAEGPFGLEGPIGICGHPGICGDPGIPEEPVKYRLQDAFDFLECNIEEMQNGDVDLANCFVETSKPINIWGAKSPEHLMTELDNAFTRFKNTAEPDHVELMHHNRTDDTYTIVVVAYWELN